MLPRDCQCLSLFDPLDHKVLLPEMEEIEGEPIICQTLFGPLGLPEWLSIFLEYSYVQRILLIRYTHVRSSKIGILSIFIPSLYEV